jgi:hypothetical protein
LKIASKDADPQGRKSFWRKSNRVIRCGAPVSAPHSSVFARLASGAFYEIIKSDGFVNSTKMSYGERSEAI